MSHMAGEPTSRKRVALNSLWNIVGQASPILIAIATLPLIIRNIGIERYGLLTLIWVLIGYASLFDLGIGRALTRVVALRVAENKADQARQLAQAGLSILLICGVIAGLLFATMAPSLASSALKVSAALSAEAVESLQLVAISLPLVMLTSGYTGILSAHQHFKPLNLIKVGMGLFTYGGPALLSFFTPNLAATVALLVAMRLLSTLAHALVCRRFCALNLRFALPQRLDAQQLLGLGGWMTVSNVVSPLLGYMDRFVVATLVPIGSVAYYATAFDLLSRSMVLPYSLMSAIFPVASAVAPGSEGAVKLFHEMARALLAIMFPVTFTFFVLAEPGLSLWLGADFAKNAAPVLQILAIGVLVNTLAQAPATLIQAAGHPRWMAIAHLCELPLFVLLLWLLTKEYGIVGAAVAAALRNSIDAIIVTLLAMKGLLATRIGIAPLLHVCVVAGLFGGSLFVTSTAGAVGYLCAGLSVFVAYFWACVLSYENRRSVRAWREPRWLHERSECR